MPPFAVSSSSSSFDDADDVPQEFLCCITGQIMIQPVMTRSGHSFEKKAILKWISKHGTCPMTRKPLLPSGLVSNRNLQFKILQWKGEQDAARSGSSSKHQSTKVTPSSESSPSSSSPKSKTKSKMNLMYIYKALERDMRSAAEPGAKAPHVDITDAVSRDAFFRDGLDEVLEVVEGW